MESFIACVLSHLIRPINRPIIITISNGPPNSVSVRENLATTQMRRLWLTCGVLSLPRLLHSSSILRPTSSSSRASLISATSLVASSSSTLSSPTRTSRLTTVSSMASKDEGAVFNLSDSSLLKILKGDITKWSVDSSSDAIVTPANERMLGGGGADGAIHRAAGPQLRAACYEVPEVRPGVRCPTGEARVTPGFNLPASRVIHTVGPIYDSDVNPQESLTNAYKNSLRVAKENNIKYIAFPAISCGIYGYPFDEAATIGISTIKQFSNDFKEVHFVLFADDIFSVWVNKAKEVLQKA